MYVCKKIWFQTLTPVTAKVTTKAGMSLVIDLMRNEEPIGRLRIAALEGVDSRSTLFIRMSRSLIEFRVSPTVALHVPGKLGLLV